MESPPDDLPKETIIIVGCVCGSIVLVLLITLVVLCLRRHNAKRKYDVTTSTSQSTTSSEAWRWRFMFSDLPAQTKFAARYYFHTCLSVHRGRIHSSRMRTARSSLHGEGGLCPGRSLSRGLCPGRSLSRGVSVQGVSVQRVSVQGVSLTETHPPWQRPGQYPSY